MKFKLPNIINSLVVFFAGRFSAFFCNQKGVCDYETSNKRHDTYL